MNPIERYRSHQANIWLGNFKRLSQRRQIVRRRADLATDDPGVSFPMPKLEDLVHPNLLDVIGTPEDFLVAEALTREPR